MSNRRAFTLTELVVSISIISVLLALTVPAVMYARESSRRNQCRVHLAGLGKALHTYESFHQEFPAAIPANSGAGMQGQSRQYAPHVALLPHLDQMALFQRIDRSQLLNTVSYYLNPGQFGGAGEVRVSAFLCPSDSGESGTNYRVCMGPHVTCWDWPELTSAQFGPFVMLKSRTAADFSDGMSHTVAMSEKIKAGGDQAGYSQGAFWYSGLSNLYQTYHHASADEMRQVCGSLVGTPLNFQANAGKLWLIGSYDYTWYNHVPGPNAKISDCAEEPWSANPPLAALAGSFSASSQHSGGVNTLFFDGAVRFISDAIDLTVWRALATRAGGEPIGDAAY